MKPRQNTKSAEILATVRHTGSHEAAAKELGISVKSVSTATRIYDPEQHAALIEARNASRAARQQEIVDTYRRLRSYSETARQLGISRVRVHQAIFEHAPELVAECARGRTAAADVSARYRSLAASAKAAGVPFLITREQLAKKLEDYREEIGGPARFIRRSLDQGWTNANTLAVAPEYYAKRKAMDNAQKRLARITKITDAETRDRTMARYRLLLSVDTSVPGHSGVAATRYRALVHNAYRLRHLNGESTLTYREFLAAFAAAGVDLSHGTLGPEAPVIHLIDPKGPLAAGNIRIMTRARSSSIGVKKRKTRRGRNSR